MTVAPEFETLVALLAAGELDPPLAEEVRARIQADPEARALLAACEAFEGLVRDEIREAPRLSARTAERLLGEIRGRLEEGDGDPQGELPEVMTPEEVARTLRVGSAELATEMHTMPFFEFAGRLRIRREALFAWIEARENRSRRERLYALASDRE